MNEIKLLDKSVYNRIAAGEVVERPLSIVKELIENSIDAGATAISIDIENGGITRIAVSDNGKGISSEDVPTAFMAHATSKIRNIGDLDNISTLGFRGEALPSIAAVSVVKMNTRTCGSETGYSFTVDNGEITDSGMCGCPVGTSVTVTGLFDKIPARKKFLKKPALEEAAITNTVSKLILANWAVSFKYSVNGKVILRSSGQSTDSAVYAVYGKDFFDGLLPINAEYMDISLSGYACKPSASKHTKSFQTLIVNGRYVINEDISYWIYGCYMNYLMKRQYPAYVLYLNLPYDLVDVNVHPNKLEIKFANEPIIKKLVTDAVKNQIIENLMTPQSFSTDAVESEPAFVCSAEIAENENGSEPPFIKNDAVVANNAKFDSLILGEIHTEKIKSDYVVPDILHDSVDKSSYGLFKSTIADITAKGENADKSFYERIAGEISSADIERIPEKNCEKPMQQIFDSVRQAGYCGKIFNTYLIYECGSDVFIIDQHAAHERILFDKLVDSYNKHSVAVQQMLIPYTFTLTPEESEVLSEKLKLLDEFGFHFEKYDGCSFSLKSVPAECSSMDLSDFLDTLIRNVLSGRAAAREEIFRDNLAQCACKAAVKGGMDIPLREIDALVNDMVADGRILVCPHGRPIVIRLSKTEIEKMFKRIV